MPYNSWNWNEAVDEACRRTGKEAEDLSYDEIGEVLSLPRLGGETDGQYNARMMEKICGFRSGRLRDWGMAFDGRGVSKDG